MRIEQINTVGLIIDIQERLLPAMSNKEEFLINTIKLINGLKALDVPMVVTEQYRKGLGETVNEIKELFSTFESIEKIAFSCCDEPVVVDKLNLLSRKNVIVCGIESHVCVLQTVLDLKEAGYVPVVVTDCISSRKVSDKEIALRRMIHEGAILTTSESILFELTRRAGTDTFKAISKLVK